MAKPLVSIVMLAWNRIDDVRESLSKIAEMDYEPYEVIVVDNASTDGTAAMVEKEFPAVRLIRMSDNIGIAAYNAGFDQARGEYIVILDDDSFPAKHAVKRMVEAFEEDERLGVVAFDVRNYERYAEIEDEWDDEGNETGGLMVAQSQYLMSFNGAGVGIRRELFRQIGYYPEEFFLYQNEMDCAFKILDAGYRIEHYSNIVAFHKYSPKNRTSWRAPFYYTRNCFWLIWKHYPADLAMIHTLRLVNLCFYYSMEQKTWVYMKAMAAAFVNIRKLIGKRKPVKRVIARQLRLPLNIPFTFYR